MQMRAENDVDVLGRRAGLAQACEIRRIALMETRQAGAFLVISSAAFEQDRVPVGADEPGMHARDKPVVFGGIVMRHEPRQMPPQHLALEPREVLLR